MNLKKLTLAMLGVLGFTFTSGEAWIAYVADGDNTSQGVLDAIDINDNTLQSPILFVPSSSIVSVAVQPNDLIGYFVDSTTATLVPFSIPDGTLGTTISLGGGTAQQVAITPNSDFAFVTSRTPNELIKINLATSAVTHITTGIGTAPFGVAITPNSNRVYVANSTSSNISIFNANTNAPLAASPIAMASDPVAIAITPNGSTALVTLPGIGTVAFIDLATNTVFDSLIVSPGLSGTALAISPDGLIAYVADATNVIPIDIATRTLGTPIPIGTNPVSLFFTPDGNTAYVVNGNDTYTRINDVKTTPAPLANLPLTANTTPFDVVITPDRAPVAAFTITELSTFHFRFNASSSTSPEGDIATYRWNFGDGTPVVTTANAIVTHTFASEGSFTVTLRVTNTAGTSTVQTFTGRVVSNNGGPSARLAQIVVIGESSPTNFRGKQIEEEFATQKDIINVLRWDPPAVGTDIVTYRLYRDSALTDLIAEIPATHKLEYLDHNRHKHVLYTYFLVAVDGAGLVSPVAGISVE